MNVNKKILIEKAIILLSIILVLFLWINHYYFSNFVALLTIALDVYCLIKSRKNIFAFFIFLSILYFDYSVIFSKYFFHLPGFNWIFQYIKYDNTMFVGISCLYFFHAITTLLVKQKFYERKNNIFDKSAICSNIPNTKLNEFIILIIIFISIVLLDCLFFHIYFSMNSIYEYLIIPIVILLVLCKGNYIYNKIVFVLIVLSAAVNIYAGNRVTSLSPLIAYFFVNYYKKINYKKLLGIMICVIFIYTIFGTYGDLLIDGKNINDLKISDYNNKMTKNLFTLDTAYSSYWTGLTFVESTNFIPSDQRRKNFIQYISSYTILGSKSNYAQVTGISRQYYLHWGGGFIMMYFYYWLGVFGVIIISVYFSYLLNVFSKINYDSNNYVKILFLYFICTIPRWYLYFPTSLFRGIFVLSVVYLIFSIFINHNNNYQKGSVKND